MNKIKIVNKILFSFLLIINLIFSIKDQKESYHLFHSAGQDFRSIYKIMINGFQPSNYLYTNYNGTNYTCFWNITERTNDKLNFGKNIDKIFDQIIEEEKTFHRIIENKFYSSTYTIYNGGFYINETIEDKNSMIINNNSCIDEEIRIKKSILPEKIKSFYGLKDFMENNILNINPLDIDRLIGIARKTSPTLMQFKKNVLSAYENQINFFQNDLNIKIDIIESNKILNDFISKFSKKKDEYCMTEYYYAIRNDLLFDLKKINLFLSKTLNDHLKKKLKIKKPKFKDYIQYCNQKRSENGLSKIDILIKPNLEEDSVLKLGFFNNLKLEIQRNNFNNNNNNNNFIGTNIVSNHKVYLNINKEFTTFFPYKVPYGSKLSTNGILYQISNAVNFYYKYSDRLKKLDLFENEELVEIQKIKFDCLNKIYYSNLNNYNMKILGIQVETIKKFMNKQGISSLKLINNNNSKDRLIFEKDNEEINLFYGKYYKKKENLFDRVSRLTRRENPEFFSLEDQEKKLNEKQYLNKYHKTQDCLMSAYGAFMSRLIINEYGY